MPGLNSRAFAAKRALYNAFSADGFYSAGDTLVTYGYPRREAPKRWLMVGRITWNDENWATSGAQRQREEDFTVTVIANVKIDGGQEADVDPLLEGLLGEVEMWLRTNQTLGVQGVWSAELIPLRSQAYPVDGGYEGQFEANVRIKARI